MQGPHIPAPTSAPVHVHTHTHTIAQRGGVRRRIGTHNECYYTHAHKLGRA